MTIFLQLRITDHGRTFAIRNVVAMAILCIIICMTPQAYATYINSAKMAMLVLFVSEWLGRNCRLRTTSYLIIMITFLHGILFCRYRAVGIMEQALFQSNGHTNRLYVDSQYGLDVEVLSEGNQANSLPHYNTPSEAMLSVLDIFFLVFYGYFYLTSIDGLMIDARRRHQEAERLPRQIARWLARGQESARQFERYRAERREREETERVERRARRQQRHELRREEELEMEMEMGRLEHELRQLEERDRELMGRERLERMYGEIARWEEQTLERISELGI